MFELHRHVLRHEGLEFPVVEAGDGPPLVLLHGGGSRGEHFVPLIEPLAGRYRVIAYDQRGFGGGVVPDSVPMDHAHWAGDLVGVLDALGLERVCVLGWSLGCSVAINAASRFPGRIAAMVLVGAPDPARPVNVAALRARQAQYAALDAETLVAHVREDLAGQLSPSFREDANVLEGLIADRMASPPAMQARAIAGYATRPDLLAAARSVRCPALLVTGEHDRLSPPGDAARMALALGAAPPQVIADCGHYVVAERPQALAQIVLSALPTLAGSSSRANPTETDR